MKVFTSKSYNSISGKALTWIILLIVVVALVIGFRFGTAYFDNESLEKQVEEIARTFLLENGYDLIGNLIKTTQKYEILLEPEDIKWRVNNLGTQVNISFSYIRIVDLIVTTYPIMMNISVTKDMTKQKNQLDNIQKSVEENLQKSSDKNWDEAQELSQ